MKKSFLIICSIFFIFSCSDSSNIIAKKKFEENLEFVNDFISNETGDSSIMIGNYIAFFEQLTGIESESDGTYYGKFNATKNDYQNWKNWYEKNQGFLYWDENTRKVTATR